MRNIITLVVLFVTVTTMFAESAEAQIFGRLLRKNRTTIYQRQVLYQNSRDYQRSYQHQVVQPTIVQQVPAQVQQQVPAQVQQQVPVPSNDPVVVQKAPVITDQETLETPLEPVFDVPKTEPAQQPFSLSGAAEKVKEKAKEPSRDFSLTERN